ncbi:putative reverse transcriptase domain-containing protein [Tanacetum coccineum]
MQRGFLYSGGRGGTDKKKDGSNVGSDSSSLDVTAGNQDDDGVATDKSLNKASLESGNTPRDDHVEPNVENTRPNTTGPSVVSSPAITTSTPGMSTSYAKVTGEPSKKSMNFHTLITQARNEVDVVVPTESIRAIDERFANTAYGFFLGKRVAYPFSSMDGLDSMLKNGPWFIRNNPLILKKWNPYVNLMKEYVGNVPVWVKLHGFPMNAFSEDGLSAIATKLDTPLMLDSYTSDMCIQS